MRREIDIFMRVEHCLEGAMNVFRCQRLMG
jgi:hypothetical protein